MIFYPYDAVVPGDSVVISTTLLGPANNQGTFLITDVLSPYAAVVNQALTAVSPVILGAQNLGLQVQEGVRYYGYKRVQNVAVDPLNPDWVDIVFTTGAQAGKINPTGGAVITGLGKLGFQTAVELGLDAYRYDVGLLRQANRIVYGDPTDPVTFPGVSAAGVEIYVNPPLFRRITMGIDVRLSTGVPFNQIVSQVQDAVIAYINGQPVGQSIPISGIIGAVGSVPGVYAVSISSPTYSPTSDIITLQPQEKALIVSPTDISVVSIGNS
jgi:hypothetical protein